MVVYTKPDCRACDATKRKLDDLGVQYEVRNFDEAALKLARSKGIASAPMVVVGSEAIGGYRPDELQRMAALV